MIHFRHLTLKWWCCPTLTVNFILFQGKNLEHDDFIHNDIFTHIPPQIVQNETINENELYKVLRDKNCWMQMRGGSKLKNFITPCINSLNSSDIVIISGNGPAVTKVGPSKEKNLNILSF